LSDLSIGIDVGGTKILGGVVDSTGKIIQTHRIDTPKAGGESLTSAIADVIKELAHQHNVEQIGISAAGFISSDRETILATPNISGWNGVNLKQELFDRTGKRVVVENDANAAAWAEAKHGAGVGHKNMIMLTIGTGIGGGIVIDGALYRGAFGVAAEFGHLRVVPDGHLCGCGARGCFEQYGSGNALVRHAKEAISAAPDAAHNLLARGDGTINGVTGKDITEAAHAGDNVAQAAFNTTGHWLGAGIASLISILDPSIVVIGGGVAEAGELLLAPTRESLNRHLPFNGKHPTPEVVAAKLGNEAGLVGVADLARN